MTRTLRLLALALAAVLAAGACGDDDDSTPGAAATSTTVTTAAGAGGAYRGGPSTTTTAGTVAGDPDVALGETSLGDSLVDGDGFTLYVFANDTAGQSACDGACAEAWPPLVVEGDPAVGSGVDAALVSTITRGDGTSQVTVEGHALYRFAGDAQPGDENGQGVAGLWNVAGPDGLPLAS